MLEMTKNELNYAEVFYPNCTNTLYEGFVHYWTMIGSTDAISIAFVDGYKVMTNISNVYIMHK